MITNNCTGVIQFPGESAKSFQYNEEDKTFSVRETGEVWKKGKNFYNLRFIRNKDLSRRNSECNKNKTSNRKKSIRKNRM